MEYVLRTTRVPRRTYVQVRYRSTGQESDRRQGPYGPENPGRTGWVPVKNRRDPLRPR
jgi:hypothetical protein